MVRTISPADERRLDRQFAAIRSLDPGTIVSRRERFRLTVKDLAAGAFLRHGDHTYRVEEVSRYQETDEAHERRYDDVWHELTLFCLETGETAYLEWEEDDVIEVYASDRAVELTELRDTGGRPVGENDLDAIVEAGAPLTLDGRTFAYDDDYAAVFRRGEDSDDEPAYFYEFAADDGTALTIELWLGAPGTDRRDLRVWLSREADPDAIEILTAPAG